MLHNLDFACISFADLALHPSFICTFHFPQICSIVAYYAMVDRTNWSSLDDKSVILDYSIIVCLEQDIQVLHWKLLNTNNSFNVFVHDTILNFITALVVACPPYPLYCNLFFLIQWTKIIISILTLTSTSWRILQFAYLFDNNSNYKVLLFLGALLPS